MGDVYIDGKDRDSAILLLAAAADLELDSSVVRTTSHGYNVPQEVAEQAGFDSDGNLSDVRKDEPKAPEPTAPAKKAAAKTAPAKKTAAKKTTAKKTAAKKAPAKPKGEE